MKPIDKTTALPRAQYRGCEIITLSATEFQVTINGQKYTRDTLQKITALVDLKLKKPLPTKSQEAS